MEIKFRGINHETGEFVYGWYTKLCKGARKYDAIISDIDGSLVEFYIHDSQTIGQFTGLKDKSGVDIYKGDIVYCATRDPLGIPEQEAQFVVEFDYGSFLAITASDEQEVIGNKHQNPELLNA